MHYDYVQYTFKNIYMYIRIWKNNYSTQDSEGLSGMNWLITGRGFYSQESPSYADAANNPDVYWLRVTDLFFAQIWHSMC